MNAAVVPAKAGTHRATYHRPWNMGPRFRAGLSGERLDIAEFQLAWGLAELSTTWIDGWRLVDLVERTAQEQALADEFGEAERRYGETMQARDDAQQEIGDHAGEDLQADGVFGLTEE